MSVEKIVLDVHTELMQGGGIYKESCREMRVGRESGIDLDNCLADIRRARTIDDTIKIVQQKHNEKEQNLQNKLRKWFCVEELDWRTHLLHLCVQQFSLQEACYFTIYSLNEFFLVAEIER